MQESNQAILAFHQISKAFDDKLAIDELSLALYPGMVVGLLGQNGAGKSTLMRCALGIIKVTQGRITILGGSSENLSSAQKELIGYVPQQPFGYEGFSVDRALTLHRSFYPNWDRDLEREWLVRFDLDGQQQVQRLSVGQRQSLALIMSLAYRPKLLILDEPMSGLDPRARVLFKKQLAALKQQGVTVFFSSHVLADVEEMADTMAVLHNSQIYFSGTPDEFKQTYGGDNVEQAYMNCIDK